jgi:hypothetical protein
MGDGPGTRAVSVSVSNTFAWVLSIDKLFEKGSSRLKPAERLPKWYNFSEPTQI